MQEISAFYWFMFVLLEVIGSPFLGVLVGICWRSAGSCQDVLLSSQIVQLSPSAGTWGSDKQAASHPGGTIKQNSSETDWRKNIDIKWLFTFFFTQISIFEAGGHLVFFFPKVFIHNDLWRSRLWNLMGFVGMMPTESEPWVKDIKLQALFLYAEFVTITEKAPVGLLSVK